MIPWRLAVVAFVASMALQAHAQPAGGDFKQTREWKALNRYVGVWEEEATVTVPERKQSRASSTVAWTLGDRFLQTKSKADDNSENIFLLTYDPNRRAVRNWWFSSSGQTGVSTGSLDEATSTFTLKVDDVAPGSCTITDRLIDDDHREVKVIFKDGDGKVIFESSGTATRQKK